MEEEVWEENQPDHVPDNEGDDMLEDSHVHIVQRLYIKLIKNHIDNGRSKMEYNQRSKESSGRHNRSTKVSEANLYSDVEDKHHCKQY